MDRDDQKREIPLQKVDYLKICSKINMSYLIMLVYKSKILFNFIFALFVNASNRIQIMIISSIF
jgi:hypothetical protein